ncbi:MAG: hypothetical protein RM338_21140 [Nostoc sp. DedQUE12a]|nr:hypothetical protein [Nostoc sp. DedQUE12a]
MIDEIDFNGHSNTGRVLHFELGIWFGEKGKGFFFPLFPKTRQVLTVIGVCSKDFSLDFLSTKVLTTNLLMA